MYKRRHFHNAPTKNGHPATPQCTDGMSAPVPWTGRRCCCFCCSAAVFGALLLLFCCSAAAFLLLCCCFFAALLLLFCCSAAAFCCSAAAFYCSAAAVASLLPSRSNLNAWRFTEPIWCYFVGNQYWHRTRPQNGRHCGVATENWPSQVCGEIKVAQ